MQFRRLREEDLPMLAEWLTRPHVAEWWDRCDSMAELAATYLPRPDDESAAKPYLAFVDDVAVGYIQSYVAAAAGDGWWTGERDPGVVGIDLFVADGQSLGQGTGTRMVSEFVRLLLEDPAVTRVQGDPAVENERAIRCCLRAGFRQAGEMVTPDGPAVLMVRERC